MTGPSKEEIELLFTNVRPGWSAQARELGEDTGMWYVDLYDEGGHTAGSARFDFDEHPPRLEWGSLTLMPQYQREGFFTALYPQLGPMLQRYEFEWIIVREWWDPTPFTARGFIFRDDPAGITQAQILTIDLRDPDRPSKEWVEPTPIVVEPEEVPPNAVPSEPDPKWLN